MGPWFSMYAFTLLFAYSPTLSRVLSLKKDVDPIVAHIVYRRGKQLASCSLLLSAYVDHHDLFGHQRHTYVKTHLIPAIIRASVAGTFGRPIVLPVSC